MVFLKQINVENFKSWRGKQIIGPFLRFNCIIGTNGSGKSNVMDALSFAMGERPASLRVKHLRDLIHGAHIGQPVSVTARVTMLFSSDGEQDTAFTRTINGDTSDYSINGVHVTFSKYTEELQKIGIVTKTQNCLVFQGAVESIALKDPKERTKMLEHICQSKELAAEYNKKKEAMLKAKEDTQFHFNKKKSALVERRQVAQETVEAQKYQALQEHLEQNRLQLCLAELYHNDKAISGLSDTLQEEQRAVVSKGGTLRSSEQDVKALKKEHGRHVRELQQVEKEIRNQEHVVDQCRSQYIKAKVNTSHHIKKAEQAQHTLTKGLKMLATKEKELQEGQREVDELERTWSAYERQLQEEESLRGRSVDLNEEQLEKYKELKELARKQGAFLSQQAKKLHWELRADSERMAFDQRRANEVKAIIKNHQTQQEDLTGRAEKLKDYIESCKTSLEESRRNEENLGAELERASHRSEEVKQELSQVMEELQNAGLDTQESKQQLQRKEILEKLRRLYPENVYGRLSQLCSPIHKKYQLAVTKAFGRYMNAIVVTSEKVARECISFIKEERADPETFLPIDYLHVSPLNERLRALPPVKMMVDVVQVNAASGAAGLRKVIQFVCGNALVCDTIKEARNLAFDGPERHKTISLDGTMFSKSGVISGGSSDLRTKARCWNAKDVMHLKERKDQLTTELRDLMRLRRKESDLKQIVAHAQGVQTRLKYTKAELENLQKKNIPRCQAEVSRMQSELANLDSQIQMQEESMEAKNVEMSAIRSQINTLEDLVFLDFCAEIGVSSIREYEQEHLKQQAQVEEKRLEFESHRSRLKAKLDYDQDQLEQQRRKLQKMKEDVDKEKENIPDQRKAEEDLLMAVEEGQNKLEELKTHLISKKKEVAAAKAELVQETQRLQDINKDLMKLQNKVTSTENSLDRKRLARHQLLLAFKIQSLPINLLSGTLEDVSETQLEADSETTAATMKVYEREALLVIDYSELEPELRSLQTEEQMEAYLARLRELVSSMEAVLHRTSAPNMKAVEKMREVKDKLQGVEGAFDASSKAARKCSQEFNEVKAKRFHLFSQCFEHVSVVIDQIYKRICRNSSAQAILSADNPDEPYLGGISYSCVAPGKRFMSMDNLSGGEKALAALAWIFAVHSFRPAPFFILDEVDAALDNSNIGKVTSFIREESSENMQIIVISLKEEFFSKADALLGVYSDLDEIMSSRILTLDLRPYPLVEDEGGTQSDGEPRPDRG